MRPLIPQTVFRTSSPYNADIRVVREWGGMKLLVNGSRQSGPYIRMLWEKAFKAFRLGDLASIRRILVLGVGGGTVIGMLAKRYSGATIIAVDIDPVMIAIAKQFFPVAQHGNVRFVRTDANAFLARRKKPGWDLVIVDVFIGRHIPPFVESSAFYRRIKRLLTPRGVILVNYLREGEYRQKSDAVASVLRATFSQVRDWAVLNNRFFFAT